MKSKKVISVAFIFMMLMWSCRSDRKNTQIIEIDSINLSDSVSSINPLDTVGEGLPIFYNMYLSVELSSLFESAGAVFTSELMNHSDKTSEYITSAQKAVNLGIYAVDLSYAKVFDQVEIAGRYFNAMKQLSRELGIPDDYFEGTAERFERNIANKDSLIKLANEVYYTTENYLKKNERFTTAALIIMGGWIEAIHIAIDVAVESHDPNIIERLIDQKYSLNNLMLMLSEHKKNEVVQEYLTGLGRVKKNFDAIDVVFDADFDPGSEEGKKLIDEAVEQINEFGGIVSNFRNELVN
ncbi:MAG: hypothetical protein PVF73_05265 [Bacteroidales bacterium]|jgi:hypothetical protein